MTQAVEFVTFYLKKKVTISDFLTVSDKFNNEFLSKQKGYISRQLLVDGEMWADMVVWKTMDDAKTAIKVPLDNNPKRKWQEGSLKLKAGLRSFRTLCTPGPRVMA